MKLQIKGDNMSEELQMDSLAYSSRMLSWSPLGKLLLVIMVLIANISTESMIVPFVTLAIGLGLMAYSTDMRIPRIIGIALAEALVILAIGCGMISISGTSGPVIWDTNILWVHVHMTADSFNKAWLVLFRGVAGMAVMMAFATSTPIPYLSQALNQLRVPKEVSELVVLIYRYGFLLLERMEVMWNAAQCRLGFNGALTSIKSTASIAVGMFISSSAMADKAQTSLSCRNYRGYFPIYNEPARISLKWVAISLSVFIMILLIGYSTTGVVDMSSVFFGPEVHP